MANIGFSRPLMANAYAKPVTTPPIKPPMGRPPTDFGGLDYGAPPDPNVRQARLPGVPTGQPAINDLAPTGTMATAPKPIGGMTATRPALRPYDPNRRRFGFRDPGNR